MLNKLICQEIDRHKEEILAFGTDIFLHPDLGYREQRTSAKVKEAFTRLSLQDITPCGITGVKAWLPGPRSHQLPRVAIIGEMDAVLCPQHSNADPVTGAAHACGHHAGLAAMLGAGIGLNATLSPFAGNICLMAVPAEEYLEIGYRSRLIKEGRIRYLGGKQQLIHEGHFDDIDLALMVHAQTDCPSPQISVASTAGGFIGKMVRFIGKEAHAGGAPHLGINALNAASAAIMCIHAQRETFRDEDHVRVHPILTKGGDTVNTVPSDVQMESYVRAATITAMRNANHKVNRAICGASYAIGTQVRIDDLPGYLPLSESPELSQLFAANIRALLPEVPVNYNQPFCGSTDMGDLSFLLPVIQPTISGFSGALHSRDFQVTDPDMAYLASAKLMAMTVFDLLSEQGKQGNTITGQFPRKTKEDYDALWQAILTEAGTERRDPV